jgi:predicted glycosyltransferase
LKVLFDINHPAHVHFFRWPISILKESGVDVIVTSRHKDVTMQLLKNFQIESRAISSLKSGKLTLLVELISRDYQLFKIVKKEKPAVLLSIGGTFIAHVGVLTGTPSLVFYDTENAKLQNFITYPFATEIHAPNCYESKLPKKKSYLYPGYHELSYLHPNRFKFDPLIAEDGGIKAGTKNFFIRLVSWNANHDIGETGWDHNLLNKLISKLSPLGNIIISAESKLPDKFSRWIYKGDVKNIHHVIAGCDLVLGESATMASESAVLGVPAIYMAETGRGYTNEQEKKYFLVKNIHKIEWEALSDEIDCMIERPVGFYREQLKRLLEDKIDVSEYVVSQVLKYQKR